MLGRQARQPDSLDDLHELRELMPVPEICVVINVDTEVLTSLAIASALRHAEMPVLLINCTDKLMNRTLCRTLGTEWGFDVFDMRLDIHGVSVDHLFREIHSERILLLDSDAEIRSAAVIPRMREELLRPDVFGSGWINDYWWLYPDPPARPIESLFIPRPYMPCAFFKTNVVRFGLHNGRSFAERFVLGPQLDVADKPPPELMSGKQHLASTFDTGAEMMQFLQKYTPYHFEGPRGYPEEDEVFHYGGMTRTVLGGGEMRSDKLSTDEIEQLALNRLRTVYPEMWPGFAAAVTAAQSVTQ
jgi:hypothetical protein